MSEIRPRHFLPALMGSLHQQRAEGELVLEQNDGTRRLYWADGELKYLRSDAGGEQFGSFLIRRGVMDIAALRELLAEGDGIRVGDRVVQLGLMTQDEAHERLQELLGSILLHAMEHPVLKLDWLPGPLDGTLSGDLQFRLDHRWLVWDTFQSAKVDQELVTMVRSEPDWRWRALPNLLDAFSDLPLTPDMAYALTLLGTTEPLGANTIASLTRLPMAGAARLVATLWALGGLTLVRGKLPLGQKPPARSEPEPEPAPEPAPEPVSEPVSEPAPVTPPEAVSGPEPEPEATPLAPVPPRDATLSIDLGQEDFEAFDPNAGAQAVFDEVEDAMAAERAHQSLVKARSYLMQDRTSEAIRALEESTRLDGHSPRSFETWMLLGRLRLSNPAWATRAIKAFQAASRLDPRSAEPFLLMGDLYHRKGFEANAQGCFRRARELDPTLAEEPVATAEEEFPGSDDTQSGLMGKLRGMFRREMG